MAAEESSELTFDKEATAEHSFDQLARELADGTLSRRRALKLMGAALVGSVLASVPGVAWAAKPAPCPSGVQKCGKNCCPDGTFICAQGKCACPAGTTRISNTCCQNEQVCGQSCGCQQGQGCCNNVCTDLNTTTDCGTCGNACGTGQICVEGRCVAEPCDPDHQACFVEDPSRPDEVTCVCCAISDGAPCCGPNLSGGVSCQCCSQAQGFFCCPGGACCPEINGVIECFSGACCPSTQVCSGQCCNPGSGFTYCCPDGCSVSDTGGCRPLSL